MLLYFGEKPETKISLISKGDHKGMGIQCLRAGESPTLITDTG